MNAKKIFPLSRFESSIGTVLLVAVLVANLGALAYVVTGSKSALHLMNESKAMATQLSPESSRLAVTFSALPEKSYADLARTVSLNYAGVSATSSPAGMTLSARTLDDYAVLQHALAALYVRTDGVRWKINEMCMGECSAAPAVVGAKAPAGKAATGPAPALSLTLSGERALVAVKSAEPAPVVESETADAPAPLAPLAVKAPAKAPSMYD